MAADNEEFNNFLFKVCQVEKIVQKLVSKDKQLQEIGDLEAKQYLGELPNQQIDENAPLQTKDNRTIINYEMLHRDDNPSTQSPESFMKDIEKDAEMRFKDKCRRRERMETLKKQANLAFRRGEFEKALTLYNKAIEQIKDSCLLYTNRALTHINLKLFDRAVQDCQLALRLNENSLKARLLLAKAYYLNGDLEGFHREIEENKKRNCEDIEFIDDFVQKIQ